MSTYTVETILCGYHIYKFVWEAAVGQVLPHLFRSDALICSVLGCQCTGVFSLRLLVSPQLWYSKKEQPSKWDHQALVAMSLSESTWARASKERWCLEYVCAKMPAACYRIPCYVPHPFYVCNAPKNLQRKLSWHCTNQRTSWKFSPSKVSSYMVLYTMKNTFQVITFLV